MPHKIESLYSSGRWNEILAWALWKHANSGFTKTKVGTFFYCLEDIIFFFPLPFLFTGGIKWKPREGTRRRHMTWIWIHNPILLNYTLKFHLCAGIKSRLWKESDTQWMNSGIIYLMKSPQNHHFQERRMWKLVKRYLVAYKYHLLEHMFKNNFRSFQGWLCKYCVDN